MSLVVNKSLSTNPSAIPQNDVTSKSLGQDGGVNPLASTDLRVWYQEACRVYNQATQGIIPATPEEIQSLQAEMQKALAELSGGQANYGSSWDPMTQGAGAAAATPPSGAKVGPNGNFIYDSTEANLGFPGQVDQPIHVYSRDINLDLDSTSVEVSIDKVTDTDVSPAEEVTALTVTNKATGETCKYYIHNEDKANIKINTAYGADQVINNTDLDIEIGEYKAKAENAVQEGPTPSRELEGEENIYGTDEAYEYDGRGNAVVEFNPAAGVDQTHVVNGNPSINCLNSDQIDVYKTATGSEVIVKHSDGSIDKFVVPEGYYININHALPQSIKWHEGTKGGAIGGFAAAGNKIAASADLAANPHTGSASEEDSSVVPEAFADFVTVNNQPNEDALPPEVTAPQEVQDLAALCGLDDITKIPESLWNEIEHPTLPPSQALLTFLTNNYPDLKAAVQNPGLKSSDPAAQQLAWSSVKSSLLAALTQVYGPQVSGISADEAYADIQGLDLEKTIFLGGLPFTMSPGAGFVQLTSGASATGASSGSIDPEGIPDYFLNSAMHSLGFNGGSFESLFDTAKAQVIEKAKALTEAFKKEFGFGIDEIQSKITQVPSNMVMWLIHNDPKLDPKEFAEDRVLFGQPTVVFDYAGYGDALCTALGSLFGPTFSRDPDNKNIVTIGGVKYEFLPNDPTFYDSGKPFENMLDWSLYQE